MSAPKVGDRVRVIAGQWTGWEGWILDVTPNGHSLVEMTTSPTGQEGNYMRTLWADEVETVPTTPASTPVSDERGGGVMLDPEAANGAQNGGRR